MTNRALTLLVVLVLFAFACGKDEPAPTVSAAPPTTALAEPAVTAAAAPAAQAAAEAARAGDDEQGGPGFEGEVDLRVSSVKDGKKEPKEMRLQVKGRQLRFALPEGIEGPGPQLDSKGYVVIDGRDKRVLAVSDEKRQVMVLPLDKIGEMSKLGAGAAAEGKPGAEPKVTAKAPELKKTGKTDTVAGRSCEEWAIANEDKTRVLVCVANEQASWLELPTLGLPSQHGWARELMDGKHLPLRAIMFEASGKETMRVELVRLEAKALDDALFAPPAGYKVLDMGEMMRGVASMVGGAMPPGAGGQMPGAMPPGMAGKMPPNFQAMMARMREQMQAMKAQQGAQGAAPARAQATEKLAAPAEAAKPAKATTKAKATAKATETAASPAEK